MTILFTILIVIASILLSLIILVQNPKGGGLGSAFGGANPQMFGGVKKTTDFLDRSTWGLAIALIVLVIGMNMFNTTTNKAQSEESTLLENADDNLSPSVPGQQAPVGMPEDVE
jgi:preprotein translocase subunit SecG